MKIYFFLKSIPEFRDLPRAQLKKKFQFYYIESLSHWAQWLGLGLTIFSIDGGIWLADETFHLSGIDNLILKALFVLLGAVIYQVFVLGTIAHLVKQEAKNKL